MRIEMQSDVRVHHVVVLAEMAEIARRPELGMLCREAVRDGHRITPSLVGRILPGTSERGAENVVRWCRHTGLCTRDGTLTPVGEKTSDTDTAPIPEQGLYDLWVGCHPVFGTRLLEARRAPSERGSFDRLSPLPVDLGHDMHFESVVAPPQQWLFRRLLSNHGEPRCLPKRDTTLQLRWTWDFDAGRDYWSLHGELEQDDARMQVRPSEESAGIDLWGTWAAVAPEALRDLGDWNPASRRLAVPLERLPESSLGTFRHELILNSLRVPRHGEFRRVRLANVPVEPASEDDARAWALERLARKLEAKPVYRTQNQYETAWHAVVDGTPLEPWRLAAPPVDGLLANEILSTEVFWSLAVPHDLGPLNRTLGEAL